MTVLDDLSAQNPKLAQALAAAKALAYDPARDPFTEHLIDGGSPPPSEAPIVRVLCPKGHNLTRVWLWQRASTLEIELAIYLDFDPFEIRASHSASPRPFENADEVPIIDPLDDTGIYARNLARCSRKGCTYSGILKYETLVRLYAFAVEMSLPSVSLPA